MRRVKKCMGMMMALLLTVCMLPITSLATGVDQHGPVTGDKYTEDIEKPTGTEIPLKEFTTGTIKIEMPGDDTTVRDEDPTGDMFNVYKIVDITYDAETNNLTYAFTESVSAYAASEQNTSTIKTLEQYQAKAPQDDATSASPEDVAAVKEFINGLAAYLVKNETAATTITTTKENTTPNITGSWTEAPLGQYLLVGAGNYKGAYVYQPMTATFKISIKDQTDEEGNTSKVYMVNPEVTVYGKRSKPGLDKTVDDHTVGDNTQDSATNPGFTLDGTVTFTIVSDIPTYPSNAAGRKYYIVDRLPQELDFAEMVSIKLRHTVEGDEADITGRDSITPDYGDPDIAGNADNHILTWQFDYAEELKDYADGQVVIKYKAKVNPDAIKDNVGGTFTNTAELHYSNDPYSDYVYVIDDPEVLKTFGIEILKYERDHNDILLEGAEFAVYEDSEKDGKLSADQKPIGTIVTGKDGVGKLMGLDEGSYLLKETKAPTGYQLSEELISVTIGGDSGLTPGEEGYVHIDVANAKVTFILPITGDTGVMIFSVIGLMFMAAAVCALMAYKNRRAMKY